MCWGGDQAFGRKLGESHGVVLERNKAVCQIWVAGIGCFGKYGYVCKVELSGQLSLTFQACIIIILYPDRVESDQTD